MSQDFNLISLKGFMGKVSVVVSVHSSQLEMAKKTEAEKVTIGKHCVFETKVWESLYFSKNATAYSSGTTQNSHYYFSQKQIF